MRKMLIKFIIASVMLSIFSLWNVAAITETIHFNAIIPEDYGVIFPDNALRMDHLFFSIDNVLIDKEGNADISMDMASSFVVDLIYYGNLSSDYEVTLSANASSGWLSTEDQLAYVPINVTFREFLGENGIKSTIGDSDSSIDIRIPATGPARGLKVGEMVIAWESGLMLQPGLYDMELNLSLRSR